MQTSPSDVFKVPFLLSLLVIHLKHPLWLPLLKDIFTPEFLRKAHAFFAKSDELVTEFPAEIRVTDKVCLHLALKRRNHVQPCVFLVGDVLGPCDQLILSSHHNIND